MKKYLLLLVAAFIFAATSSVHAAGYGTAGCGLGSIVFGDEPGMIQIVAATLNGTGGQVFGMTSGTSNCGSSGLVLAEKEQSIFVARNQTSLIKEMAAGEGETLDTLASMLGCSAHTSEQFGSFTQDHFVSIVGNGNSADEMLNSLKKGIDGDAALSSACTNVTL